MPDTPWIFGYGSLIWRPGFESVEHHDATASGWTRRFWQGSPDHRGVPDAPGRVVTLVQSAAARCVGRAFRVERSRLPAVLDALDVREQGGYDRHRLSVRLADGRSIEAVTYIAPPGNAHWLGAGPQLEVVRQIRSSHGPSGANLDYVLNLADALAEIGYDDAHVQALAAALRAAD